MWSGFLCIIDSQENYHISWLITQLFLLENGFWIFLSFLCDVEVSIKLMFMKQ